MINSSEWESIDEVASSNINKSGFLYKHDDPRYLAKALNTVIELDQDTLISIGNEGRKNVAKKFDVEAMCDSTLREYKKLLNIQ